MIVYDDYTSSSFWIRLCICDDSQIIHHKLPRSYFGKFHGWCKILHAILETDQEQTYSKAMEGVKE